MALAQATLLATLAVVVQEDVGALLEPIHEQYGLPAISAALVERGELAAIGASGVRRVGSDVAVTTDDRWYLGSCTKAMTATLVARLVQRGELEWDTTLAQVFPERAEAMHAGYRDTTLRQLLDHRAGLPEDHSGGGRNQSDGGIGECDPRAIRHH